MAFSQELGALQRVLPAPTLAEAKGRRLQDLLQEMGSVLVAYSGGVDSTYLMAAAHEALGGAALAVTALSPAVPRAEAAAAAALARARGWRHLEVDTAELSDPDYVANGPRRCYFCKTELYGRLGPLAAAHGLAWIANGTNTDDLGDWRPGLQAAEERRVRSPLVEAGLAKAEVRELSRLLGLPTWDKPAQPCLASRLPYGTRVTVAVLGRIELAEAAVRALGVRELRVRHFGSRARVEVPRADVARLAGGPVAEELRRRLEAIGYREVEVDEFRSGRLNEALDRRVGAAPATSVPPGALRG